MQFDRCGLKTGQDRIAKEKHGGRKAKSAMENQSWLKRKR